MNTRKWTTKNGRKVRIKDMTDQHLINTCRMLIRAHSATVSLMWQGLGMLQGEMACYYAEQDLDRAEDIDSLHPLYPDLEAEALRRGLRIWP